MNHVHNHRLILTITSYRSDRLPSKACPGNYDDDAIMPALRQIFVLIAAMVVAVDQSVKQETTNFTNVICTIINKCICTKYVSSHVIIYQCFYRFVLIRGVALQACEEYNNLPHRIPHFPVDNPHPVFSRSHELV
jgi:hypothetical protein